jgi:hypothetical protein
MKNQDAQRHQIKVGAKTKRSINPKTIRARQLRRSYDSGTTTCCRIAETIDASVAGDHL